jgi:hypothetical protein
MDMTMYSFFKDDQGMKSMERGFLLQINMEHFVISGKCCTKCETRFPTSQFRKDKQKRDGLTSWCRGCLLKKDYSVVKRRRGREMQEITRIQNKLYSNRCKLCTKCKKSLDLKEFGKSKLNYDGLTSLCLLCVRKRYNDFLQFKTEAKEGSCCENCGYNNIVCLVFAYKDLNARLKNKKGTTKSPARICSITTLKREMSKIKFLCKNCNSLRWKMERDENAAQTKTAQYHRKYTQRDQKAVTAEKLKRGKCIDCEVKVEESNSCMFEFDHLPQYQKVSNISVMVCEHRSKKEICEEMKKCELRCSNCHLLKSIERQQIGSKPGR